MSNESGFGAQAREMMSALLDGELDGAEIASACGHWRDDAESRSAWHAYHLIGDVLRSDDLACHPVRDANFLHALRGRLAKEPVVLAPQARATAPVELEPRAVRHAGARRRTWLNPATVAAGFVAVAGVLSITRPGVLPWGSTPAEKLSQAAPAPGPGGAGPAVATAIAPQEMPALANGQLIRDARLDRYLAAHQQFAGSSALGVPSAYLRNATAEVPAR